MNNWPATGMPPTSRRTAPRGRSNLMSESPCAPNIIADGRVPNLEASNGRPSWYGPHPHQVMNIPHRERGGNGVTFGVVNQWFIFRLRFVDLPQCDRAVTGKLPVN